MSDMNEKELDELEEEEEIENYITLTDDDGNEVSFEMIGTVEYEEHIYAVLLPFDDEDDEVVILEVIPGETPEEDDFVSVNDDELLGKVFEEFKKIFDRINTQENLRQQIIPYFISSHPGCKEEDMAELAVITKKLDFHLEQVQDFTPTPMTVSTETWYTGFHPYTLESVFSARTQREKLAQRLFFFWYQPEQKREIINELRRIHRTDLIDKLYGRH